MAIAGGWGLGVRDWLPRPLPTVKIETCCSSFVTFHSAFFIVFTNPQPPTPSPKGPYSFVPPVTTAVSPRFFAAKKRVNALLVSGNAKLPPSGRGTKLWLSTWRVIKVTAVATPSSAYYGLLGHTDSATCEGGLTMTTRTTDPALRLKKLEEQIAKKKAELIRERGRLSETTRKNRMRRMIQIGELAEIAGVIESENAFLLGVLLKAKEIDPVSAEWRDLKQRGDAVLTKREATRKKDVLKDYQQRQQTADTETA
ncbi:MAG: conjugal transfer protein TraD [Deltaproteobacteria bacterium]|nr:conjugal transfer protein TraD [Deltaproteobacteria bacterium]